MKKMTVSKEPPPFGQIRIGGISSRLESLEKLGKAMANFSLEAQRLQKISELNL